MDHYLKVPQIGEAIHAVNIIKYLKAIGDRVALDEPVVTLETNKAALDIESPVAGIIKDIRFAEGLSVPVGETIIVLSSPSEDAAAATPPAPGPPPVSAGAAEAVRPSRRGARNGALSPRHKFLHLSGNIVPLARKAEDRDEAAEFTDRPLPPRQRELNRTLAESARQVIPANIQISADNRVIERVRRELRRAGASLVPSRLEMIAWAVVGALKEFPRFRSRIVGEDRLREFHNPALGIALALPDDGLTTAVIRRVFAGGFGDFGDAFRRGMAEAKQDKYAPGYHCLAISDLSAYGVTGAIPVVAGPAAATLFVGKPAAEGEASAFQLSLSFDHRIANGVGAARFLARIGGLVADEQIFDAPEIVKH